MRLPTLEFEGDLPDGFTPVEAVVVITGIDAAGEPEEIARATTGLRSFAAVGLLITTADKLRHGLLEAEDD